MQFMHKIFLTGALSPNPYHLFNIDVIDWCAKKKSEASIRSSNSEIRSMYTCVLDKKWIRNFCISIGYPIRPP